MLQKSRIRKIVTNSAALTLFATFAACTLAVGSPQHAPDFKILGDVFIAALKFIAPFLMFFSISTSIAGVNRSLSSKIGKVIFLYVASIFCAIVVSAVVSYIHPVRIAPEILGLTHATHRQPVTTNFEIFVSVLRNPPLYLTVVFAGVIGGCILRYCPLKWRVAFENINRLIFQITSWVLKWTPLGIFGIVCSTIARSTEGVFALYGKLLLNLTLSVALIFAISLPLLYRLCSSTNPFPVLWTCLKDSALFAFLTRSSIANLPVNLKLAEKLQLDLRVATPAISLGAVIHMPGASVTIVTFSFCALTSLGLPLDVHSFVLLVPMVFLCTIAASGVPAGGLLVLPIALSVLGIDLDTAMLFVSIGFVTGVVQDAFGTALNSASDVYLTAAVCCRSTSDE